MQGTGSRHAGVLVCAVLWLLVACQPETTPESQAYSAPVAASSPVEVRQNLTLPAPSATPPCRFGAEFIEDLTIPDGSVVEAGQALDKRWAVRNTGSCDWGPGYRLVRLDSGPLQGVSEMALYPARAGETAVWQISLIAPQEPGEYLASWQARSPEGLFFGDQVFILISVAEASAANP